MQTTSVRVDVATHRELKSMAASMDVTVGDAVRIAVRRLHQAQIGADLRAPLDNDDTAWLDADLG